MKDHTPKSMKGFLKLLINIAEVGNTDRKGDEKLTHEEHLEIGGLIADIQNSLGENRDLLSKYGLEYDASL